MKKSNDYWYLPECNHWEDGTSLFSQAHPTPKRNLWQKIVAWFKFYLFRPKLTGSNLKK